MSQRIFDIEHAGKYKQAQGKRCKTILQIDRSLSTYYKQINADYSRKSTA